MILPSDHHGDTQSCSHPVNSAISNIVNFNGHSDMRATLIWPKTDFSIQQCQLLRILGWMALKWWWIGWVGKKQSWYNTSILVLPWTEEEHFRLQSGCPMFRHDTNKAPHT